MSNKCKIVIITDTYVGVPGGSERHLLNFLSGLSGQFEARIFQLNPDGNPLYEDGRLKHKDNVELISFPIVSLKSVQAFKLIMKLYKYLLDFKPDVVISYHEKSDLINYMLSTLPFMQHKIVSSKRDMGLKLNGRLGVMMSRINPKFDAITAPSRSIIKQVISKFNACENKTYVIANGVDLNTFGKACNDNKGNIKSALGLPEGKKLIVTVGWLRPGKGHEYLIEALSQFDKSNEWLVVILGEGPDLQRLSSLSKKLGCAEKVIFAGMQKNVSQWLSVADVAVSASLSEGLSNALVESSASQLPIIATDVGGNPEVVEDGFNGLLVMPEDSASIARALLKLSNDCGLMTEMALNSRIKAEQEFSIESMINSLETLYLELKGSRES
ncbi:MAG: glycosyltransferase family 4 protein [Colwellia sp.]